MLKKLISFTLPLLVSLQLQAIGRVGNGGNIIVCLKPGSGECYGRDLHEGAFYDTYEADVRYKMQPLSMKPTATAPKVAMEYALKLVEAVKKYDHEMYGRLSFFVRDFYNEANFVEGMQLLPIPDTGISFIPYHSELRQLVVQREPLAPQDKRYVVSLDLWDMMSKADQAHAILHEVFYRYALEQKREVESSEYIRYFNALVISGEVSKLSQSNFQNLAWTIFAKGYSTNP
ncbi:MAG: hypothetical protein NDI63_11055 [Pseudobdellovibrio sp.]|nr:hypothetical protein [Pseudobdellovibrio sp.]